MDAHDTAMNPHFFRNSRSHKTIFTSPLRQRKPDRPAVDTRAGPRLHSQPQSARGSFGANVEELWYRLIQGERRGPLAGVARLGLRLASWPYGLGAWTRNQLFDRRWKTVHRIAVPIVSVGNLTLGGTGKTPCVEYVAR